jgi:hypothetical protein
MVQIDPNAPSRFLAIGFEPDDWVAVLLKSHETGETAQRILPVPAVATTRFQSWLRFRNAARWSVYVSVNAVTPGRSRRRNAIAAIRHVVLDVDQDGRRVLRQLEGRRDLPTLAYVLHTSPGRLHVFWRVSGFTAALAEDLQRGLAQELGTDAAATSCSQMTRMPGFVNYKRIPHLTRMEYRKWTLVLTPLDFPRSLSVAPRVPRRSTTLPRATCKAPLTRVTRARRFLARTPAAIAGQHGDLLTFRICCRLVRGFALSDDEAVQALREWNVRCAPPWSDRELLEKVRNARRYGREPFGGLVDGHESSSSSNA